jgi:hypothetical protein
MNLKKTHKKSVPIRINQLNQIYSYIVRALIEQQQQQKKKAPA